jgi:repressor of nif and glnA expression
MIGQDTKEVERKVITILKVLANEPKPLGGTVIARRLGERGIFLGERAVRYHLKLMDERGLTEPNGAKGGRIITPLGRQELDSALVGDKVGLVISKIELLAYQTTFNLRSGTGQVPINTTVIPADVFPNALEAMEETFSAGLCAGDLVIVARSGERLADMIVPKDMMAFGTICSIVVNGCLLKAGIPMDSRFGGLLELQDGQPSRFVELVEYAGSSLDPSVIFITGKLTRINQAVRTGNGRISANFREIPAISRSQAEKVAIQLRKWRMSGIYVLGEVSEPVCEIPVGLNKVGVVLLGGLNPVAAAVESGIQGVNQAMSGVVEYKALCPFTDVLKEYRRR